MYYIFVEDEKLNGAGCARILNDDIQSIEVTEEVYNKYLEDNLLYVWNGEEIIENPEYEQDVQRRNNAERIAEIKEELAELDLKSIRPTRAGETDRLKELEAQAVELREELQRLSL